MTSLKHAGIAIALVLLVHAYAVTQGLYFSVPWFDVPMHFFGGYAMAMLGLAGFSWVRSRVEIRQKIHSQSRIAQYVLEGVFVLGFAMIIAIAWEWYEFLADHFATQMVREYGFAQMGLADTMDDFLNDFIGAIVGWYFWRSRE